MQWKRAPAAGLSESLPDAEITCDRYQLMKLANDTLDASRKERFKDNPCLSTYFELPVSLAEPYLGFRYRWTRSSRIDAKKEFVLTVWRHRDGILRSHSR
jgi:transposase